MIEVKNLAEIEAKFNKIGERAHLVAQADLLGRSPYQRINEVVMDLVFWKTLGEQNNWGTWDKNYDDLEHDFVLKYYMPNEEKTPVYHCSVCNLRKEGEALSYDTMGFNTFEPVNDKAKDAILKHHKGFKKDTWQDHMFMFLNFYVNNGDFVKAIEWLELQVNLE